MVTHDVDLDINIFKRTGNDYIKLQRCSAMTYDFEFNEIWVAWDEITFEDSAEIFSTEYEEPRFVIVVTNYLLKRINVYYCKICDYMRRVALSDLFCSLNVKFLILRKDIEMPIFIEPYNINDAMSYTTTDSLSIVPYNSMFKTKRNVVQVPVMSDIFYNAPYTTVKWSDGTTTTVKAGANDEFNKEYGLSMAIAKKYYECLEAPNPRAAFKKAAYKDAHDQTEKTAKRRAYKEEKKKKHNG